MLSFGEHSFRVTSIFVSSVASSAGRVTSLGVIDNKTGR
jgi:hypothetical protein